MPASVVVTGVDSAQRRLRALGRRGADQRGAMEREATRTQRAVSGVPVRTGRLAASVSGGADTVRVVGPNGYTIGSAVPYAPFVFRGTQRMRAQPPRVPAGVAVQAARAVSNDLKRA
jgi:hypothetical protein